MKSGSRLCMVIVIAGCTHGSGNTSGPPIVRDQQFVIRVFPSSGGDASLLAQGEQPAGLVVDDGFVYWSENSAGEIRKVAR